MLSVNDRVELAIAQLKKAQDMDYIGESVSQLEHALQCAYFAEQARHSDAVILASLFHDIGHFAAPFPQITMKDLGALHHEWIGAKLLYDIGLPPQIALLVGYHVDAKRYLTGKKKKYYDQLSEASKNTLAFQGGPMTLEEIIKFQEHRYFKEILQVRVNDEKAKVIALNVPNIDYYRPKIENLIIENNNHYITLEDELPLINMIDDGWVQRFKARLDQTNF